MCYLGKVYSYILFYVVKGTSLRYCFEIRHTLVTQMVIDNILNVYLIQRILKRLYVHIIYVFKTKLSCSQICNRYSAVLSNYFATMCYSCDLITFSFDNCHPCHT